MNTGSVEHYRAEMEALSGQLPGSGLDWLADRRRQALSNFEALGFPTTRDEDWKYTNVQPIVKHAFRPVTETCVGLLPEDLDLFVCRSMNCHLLVFVNGRFAPQLSDAGRLDEGIDVTSLGLALEAEPDSLQPYLAQFADAGANGFSALNTAFMGDGALVRLPANSRIPDPVHLLFVSTKSQDEVMSQPRNLIVAGENSQATVVESYVGIGDAAYFTNAMTEIRLDAGANLEHYKLQEESRKAYHVSSTQVSLQRNSRFLSHSVSIGGRLARNDINAVFEGEGGECSLNGLYLANGRQHVDNHTRIDHAVPRCTSREYYKGIINDHGRGVFNGFVYVHPDAQHTDAQQSNSNLLLSPDAEIDTKPQLEIYADDVKCSHGATVGQLDEDMLFYLRTRGIGEATARGFLTYGFAQDVIERMTIGPVRDRLEHVLVNLLPYGEHIKDIV